MSREGRDKLVREGRLEAVLIMTAIVTVEPIRATTIH
jgi:high-affinity Fe2+/Pb2+ permease